MEIGEAFRTRIEGRVGDAVAKYFDGGYKGHVTVEKSGPRFAADCVIFLDSGMTLQAEGHAYDAPAAFDAACERIEKRLRRYKRRLRSYDGTASDRDSDVAYRVLAANQRPDHEPARETRACSTVSQNSG